VQNNHAKFQVDSVRVARTSELDFSCCTNFDDDTARNLDVAGAKRRPAATAAATMLHLATYLLRTDRTLHEPCRCITLESLGDLLHSLYIQCTNCKKLALRGDEPPANLHAAERRFGSTETNLHDHRRQQRHDLC
jgi:hypothetical protein